jgi:hypothetical protein
VHASICPKMFLPWAVCISTLVSKFNSKNTERGLQRLRPDEPQLLSCPAKKCKPAPFCNFWLL